MQTFESLYKKIAGYKSKNGNKDSESTTLNIDDVHHAWLISLFVNQHVYKIKC